MEKWQNPQQAIFASEAKDLVHLFDIRADVMVSKHYAFRLTRAAAGENDRRQVIERAGNRRVLSAEGR